MRRPQTILALIGGWLVLFGLTGLYTAESVPSQPVRETNSQTQRVRVEPASGRPGSTIDQLQGAVNLQAQPGSDLQTPGQNDQLQPNSGLSDFPGGANQLQ